MNSNLSRITRVTVVVGALALTAGLHGQATASAQNFIEFGGGGAWVTGDTAAFQARHSIARNGWGGITDMYYSGEKGTNKLTIQGHALGGENDYLADLKYSAGEKFTFTVLYRSFRTWYDGTGDYIPFASTVTGGRTMVSPGKGFFALDRSEFAIGGTFKPTETIALSLGYRHLERDGDKPSTIDGATFLTAIPYGRYDTATTPSNSAQRNIVPAWYNINERRDIFEGNVDASFGKTALAGGIRWERITFDDSRYVNHNPYETTSGNPSRFLTQSDTSKTDLFAAHVADVNKINEQWMVTAAYGYSTVKNHLGGLRSIGPAAGSPFDNTYLGPTGQTTLKGTARADTIYTNLTGLTEETERVGNLAVMYTPTENIQIVPSIRIERTSTDGDSAWTQGATATKNASNLIVPGALSSRIGADENSWDETTVALEGRYTGIPNWVFVGKAESATSKGDISHADPVVVPAVLAFGDTLKHVKTTDFGATANWYPCHLASMSFIYKYTYERNRYAGEGDDPDDIDYMRYQGYEKANYAVRLTLRPASSLTYVARLDSRKTTIDNGALHLPVITAGKYDTTMLSQSLTWTPASWVYVQVALNRVNAKLTTPAKDLTNPASPLPASFASAYATTSGLGSLAGLIPESKDSYWNGSITAGFVVDAATDVTVSYERNSVSDGYDNSALGVPYGANYRDEVVRLSATRKISENIRVTGEYAYAKSVDKASGGANDFKGNMLAAKVQYRF